MTKFPLKLSALWRQIYPALLAGALLSQAIEWMRGNPFSLPSMFNLMALATAYVLYSHWLYPTMAGPAGLSLLNMWGRRHAVPWDAISDVRLARQYFIYPSLRVRCNKGRVYWIGTDCARLAELHALATRHGGPQHPLALALSTPLYAL
jgi:hypothetical protein